MVNQRGPRHKTLADIVLYIILQSLSQATVYSSAHLGAPYSPSDLASFKLLRHLQDKVKQLRVENQASGCSPSSATTVSSALSGSDTTQVSTFTIAGVLHLMRERTVFL